MGAFILPGLTTSHTLFAPEEHTELVRDKTKGSNRRPKVIASCLKHLLLKIIHPIQCLLFLSGNRAIKWSNTGSVGKHKFTEPLTAFLFLVPALIRANCPDLSTFYSLVEDTPRLVRDELLALTNDCEQKFTIFALLGSAQLALVICCKQENLELALTLLEPDNGLPWLIMRRFSLSLDKFLVL